jgi:ribosome-associated toxin RatA of RatAB toxin-antitoxin module
MIVRRSVLVDQPASHLFDVIDAVERYPEFLPWCAATALVYRDDAVVSADIQVRHRGVEFGFRTRNPKCRPERMTIHLEHGPFKRFEGEWLLSPLGEGACKVSFTLDYEFDLGMLTWAAGPVFDHIADTLVDAFVLRSAQLPRPLLINRVDGEGVST